MRPSAPPSSVCKSLSQIQNINDVEDLSVKELKCILSANFVDFKGCCEKKELLDRVRTLWKSKQEVNKKKSKSWVLALLTVILLQIVMVSPRTHFVEKSWVPVHNQWVPVQCLGFYVTRQFIWRQTPKVFITIYSPSLLDISKAQKRLKQICIFINSHRNHTNRIFYQKLNILCILWNAYHELFCVFGNFYVSGTRTKLLY